MKKYIFILFFILAHHLQAQEANKFDIKLLIGTPAAHFEAKSIKNKKYKISNNNAKIVVLNFWYLGCAPCLIEINALNSFAAQYKGKVDFLAITFDTDKKKLVQCAKYRKMEYAIIADRKDICTLYDIRGYPTNMVINKKGEIIFAEFGYKEGIENRLAQAVEMALKE